MPYHELLGLTADAFESIEQHFTAGSYEGLRYRYLPDYRRNLEKGTVLAAGEVVRGFPKIPRTLVLETGIPRHFEDRVLVEEKLNGYNTRVARVAGEVYAFTRGGHVCPYTTHEVRTRLSVDDFFDDHPDLMVCAEVYGPENPYTQHDYPGVDSVALAAFDVRDAETGDPLPVDERRDLMDQYGMPNVPLLGSFDVAEAPAEVTALVQELDDEGREGVVMTSPDGRDLLKYTTSTAHRDSLAFAFSLPFDYGRDFMFRRLIREGFQAVEWEDGDDARAERARRLGEAILLPMVETIEDVDDGALAGDRHTVRSDPDVVEALLDHLRDQGLRLDVHDDRVEDGERAVTFTKVMRSTTDKTQAYLDGQIVRE